MMPSRSPMDGPLGGHGEKLSKTIKRFMKIGNIDFGSKPLFLAPMEDVTDIGFRKLCKRYGAAMVYTEFVSADAIIRSIPSTLAKMS